MHLIDCIAKRRGEISGLDLHKQYVIHFGLILHIRRLNNLIALMSPCRPGGRGNGGMARKVYVHHARAPNSSGTRSESLRRVARAVCEAVHPDRVILFGSRARGDYSPHSDIDLLIITDTDSIDRQKYQRTSTAAHRTVEELYGDSISVDLIRMSKGAFHDGRRGA